MQRKIVYVIAQKITTAYKHTRSEARKGGKILETEKLIEGMAEPTKI